MAYILPNDDHNGILRSKKDEALDCDLQFEWLTIKKDGDNILALAYCNQEPAKALDKDGKTAKFPGLVGFTASKAADKSPDKLTHKMLDGLTEGTFYCGHITMGASENIADKAIADEKKFALYAEDLASFTEVEKPETAPAELKFPKAWGAGGGRKYVSPKERMEQKLEAAEALLLNEKLAGIYDGLMAAIGDELSEDMKVQVFLGLIG